MALAVRMGAHEDSGAALTVKADFATLVEHAGGLLDGIGDAEAP